MLALARPNPPFSRYRLDRLKRLNRFFRFVCWEHLEARKSIPKPGCLGKGSAQIINATYRFPTATSPADSDLVKVQPMTAPSPRRRDGPFDKASLQGTREGARIACGGTSQVTKKAKNAENSPTGVGFF
jgi:hypothetical protein